MNLYKNIFLGLLLCSVIGSSPAWAQKRYPAPAGKVNDFAGVLPRPQIQQLENLLQEVLLKTKTTIVVATFKHLNGIDENTAATEIFEQWGIGDKKTDKGILFLVSMEDRRMRIETGYGVEGILPDAKAGRLLDQYVVPQFKQGLFAQGILQGTIVLAQIVAQDAGVSLNNNMSRAPPQQEAQPLTPLGMLFRGIFLILMVILFIRNPSLFFWILLSSMGGRSGRGGGSYGGGFGGGLSGGGGASRGW